MLGSHVKSSNGKAATVVVTFIGAEHKNGAEVLGVSGGQVEALQIQTNPFNSINVI